MLRAFPQPRAEGARPCLERRVRRPADHSAVRRTLGPTGRRDAFPVSRVPCNRLGLHRSAELYSAVSQSCTLPGGGKLRSVGPIRRSAKYNSAIQQIENLRYTPVSPHPDPLPQGEGTASFAWLKQ